MKSNYGVGLAVDRDPGGTGHLCSPLRRWLPKRILGVEFCRWCGKAPVCGALSRREEESNGGYGEAPARCVVAAATARQSASGSDPVLFTPSGGVFLLQRHCGKGFCMAVTLLVRWCPLPFVLYRCLVTPRFSTTTKVWSVGGCSRTAGFAAVVE